jgi:hypothetical protein
VTVCTMRNKMRTASSIVSSTGWLGVRAGQVIVANRLSGSLHFYQIIE